MKEPNCIDGMPTEFEWKICPGLTTLGFVEKIQNLMKDLQCEPEHFNDRIIFMSMYNDTVSGEQGNTEKCEHNSVSFSNYARIFPRVRWLFLGLGSEKKWYGTYSDKPDGDRDKTTERMMFERKRRKGKKSVHFRGSEVISANQLSIHGAVADLCKELSKDSNASGKLDAHENLETMDFFIEPPVADPHIDAEPQERKFEVIQAVL